MGSASRREGFEVSTGRLHNERHCGRSEAIQPRSLGDSHTMKRVISKVSTKPNRWIALAGL